MRWAWGGGPSVARWGWLGLFADLAVLTVLTLVSGVAAHESWTSDVLVTGFFLLPVLAATQLRPGICAAVVVPTTARLPAIASVATQAANDEPWSRSSCGRSCSPALAQPQSGCRASSAPGCPAIGGLLEDRTGLLDDLVHLEERESRELSERLHDGALQYVLAARLDLDDVRGSGQRGGRRSNRPGARRVVPDAALDRLRAASGRARARRPGPCGPATSPPPPRAATSRSTVDVDDWPDGVRTPVDALLFSAARELLANVVRHAGARRATITRRLVWRLGSARSSPTMARASRRAPGRPASTPATSDCTHNACASRPPAAR